MYAFYISFKTGFLITEILFEGFTYESILYIMTGGIYIFIKKEKAGYLYT